MLQNLASIRAIKPQYKNKIEHILVSDGSSDHSINLVKNHLEPNQKLILSEKIGRGCALNLGIKHASFDMISILDADDVINPEWFEQSIEYFESCADKFKSKRIYFGNVIIISKDTKSIIFPTKEPMNAFKKLNPLLFNFINPIPHLGVIIPLKALKDVGFYSDHLRSQLDWDLWFKLASSKYDFCKFDIPSGAKRIHSEQSFESKKHLKYALSGAILQLKWTLQKKPQYFVFVFLFSSIRLIWAMLPGNVRIYIRNFFNV